ncbi:MAG: T9SS type A sorting domain-containing protein [Bacteroidota bacterium]
MKTVILIIATLAISIGMAISQACLPEGITFTSQEQIDNFQVNYPDCSDLIGEVIIMGNDITNLNGLIVLTTIGGSLTIGQYYGANPSLTNLAGLDNLTFIGGSLEIVSIGALACLAGLNNLTSLGGGLKICDNGALTTLTDLDGLTSLGGSLDIWLNGSLTSLMGFENLTSIGGLTIAQNGALTSLSGLNNVTSIGGEVGFTNNYALTSLTGLENLTSIAGRLIIANNYALTSLTGLDNVTSLGGGLRIQFCNLLTSLTELNNLTSIGGYLILDNNALTSLTGLDNIASGSITCLEITGNNSLSTCAVQSICDYLAEPGSLVNIGYNAPGCNSPDEVEAACLTMVEEIYSGNGFTFIPNPSNDEITVSLPVITGITRILIFNVNGEKVMERQLTNNETQFDISALPPGVYFARVQDEKQVLTRKLIKQ